MSPLSSAQARLQDDIQGVIKGEVCCGDIARRLYSTDGGILQIKPLGVVYPKDADDIVAVVRYASENKIPLHPRGSGTGTAGEALGRGLILDLTRFMNRFFRIGTETVSVQSGVQIQRLNARLKEKQQRVFLPLCGSKAATMGSVLSRNGAGRRFLQHGLPSDYLLELKIVSAKGDVLKFDRTVLPQAIGNPKSEIYRQFSPPDAQHNLTKSLALARSITFGKETQLADEVYDKLSPLVSGITMLLNSERTAPQYHLSKIHPLLERFILPPQKSGYFLAGILQGTEGKLVDLARLITGSEGTLGIITEALVKVSPPPCRQAAAVLFFDHIKKATDSLGKILTFKPVLCELIDRRRLVLMRELSPQYQRLIPRDAEAALFVEMEAGNILEPQIEVSQKCLLQFLSLLEKDVYHFLKVNTVEDFELFDRFLEESQQVLFKTKPPFRTLPLFDDIAVPSAYLSDFLPALLDVFQQHKITAALSGHLGQGQVRVHLMDDLSKQHFPEMLPPLTDDVYALVLHYRGTMSSETGSGLLYTPFIKKQNPEFQEVFREIKDIFDPQGILNPGKIVADETRSEDCLRKELCSNYFENTEAATMNLCNGCGECFRNHLKNRMCPVFRVSPCEENSPRAKGNLLNGILYKDLTLDTLNSKQSKLLADTCFHCQRCQDECPAKVDVAYCSFQAKSAYNIAHGLPFDELFLSHLDTALSWLAPLSYSANWAAANRSMRWIIEKILQILQERQLPKLEKISFLRRQHFLHFITKYYKNAHSTEDERVALFVDTYANFFDSKLADLAVAVLESLGLQVYVPPNQRPSGLIPFSLGDRDRAEKLAAYNIEIFADLIRQGYTVVSLEPSSASCLSQDYPCISDSSDTKLLANNVLDFCSFVLQRERSGLNPHEFQSVSKRVAYHAPCRAAVHRAIGEEATAAEELLHLIPELQVHRIEQGCCGAAGVFGFRKKNYRLSLKIGMNLFKELRSADIDFGVSDCNACRLQMEHGTKTQTLHPIHLLAESLGLLSPLVQNG